MENGGYGNYGNYGGYGNYGNYGAYPDKPVTFLWSKIRVQLKRYYAILMRLWWLLPLTISGGVFLAAWIVSQMPPDYLSVARMMVSGQIQLKEGATYNEQADFFYGTQVELMQSIEVQRGAIARVQTLHPEIQPEMVKLDVSQVPHASIFILRVEAQSPAFAQAYLNACLDEYIAIKKNLRLQKTDSTTVAISAELTRLDQENEDNATAMHDFQEKHNIGFLQEQGNDAAKYLAEKNQKLADLKIEYNLLQMLDLDQNLDRVRNNGADSSSSDTSGANADGNAKQDSNTFANSGPIADYQKAKQQLELLKVQHDQLARNLRPAHPTMVALDQEIEKQNELINTLRDQSIDALKSHRDAIGVEIKNLEGVIEEWQKKALDLSTLISEFDRIKTKSDRLKEEYERLLSNMNAVDVTKNVDQDTVSILEPASEAVSVKPGLTKIIAAGFVFGLLIGLGTLFCLDQFDDRIGSFIELQNHFQQTVLGQIPRSDMRAELALLRHNDDRLALLEGFRSLRSSLIFFPTEGTRPKTLVITSALPNEGKTTISANLAITLAFSGAKTLVVDADMRRGKLSNIFGVAESNGLSTILTQTLTWREVLHQTTIENLALIPCGPSIKHPAEHLLGKVTDDFLKEIYDAYDYVIFDSPPVTLLDDTLSLAPKVDGVMVVVRFGVSAVRTTRRTFELLNQRQTNILGVICNDVQLAESEYNYGYYYRQTVDAYHKEVRTPGA